MDAEHQIAPEPVAAPQPAPAPAGPGSGLGSPHPEPREASATIGPAFSSSKTIAVGDGSYTVTASVV